MAKKGTPRRKITIAFLKDYFLDRGCELLEDKHVNSHTEMRYICKNGHEATTTWNNFSKGHGCLECSGRKQLSSEYVREEFERVGYTLLTEYTRAKAPLTYICANGHERQTTWDTFRLNYHCSVCSGMEKHTYDFVNAQFSARGFTLLTDTYENAHQYLDYKCANGHTSKIRYNKLQQGDGCRQCFYLRNSGENHPNYSTNLSDEDRILNRGYQEYREWRKAVYKKNAYRCAICSSNKYINAHHLHNFADYPELRTDIDNGVTLCKECHVGFHSAYGTAYNTAVQFEEYVALKRTNL